MTSSARPRIGILHAPPSAGNLPAIIRAARPSWLPVLLLREPVAQRYPDLVQMARNLLEVHVLADADITEQVSRLGLAGLTTYSDSELESVDRVTAELALPGTPAVQEPWDKLRQREYLWSAGLTRVAAAPVSSRAGLPDAVARVGLPSVLKPRRGVLGNGVAFLDTVADVRHQQRTRHDWHGLLVEQRIPPGTHPAAPGRLADLVSVETVSTDEHQHIAVVDYPPLSVARRAGRDGADSINETGAILPSRLPAGLLAEVQEYVSRCLTALGVRWRVTHTQLALSPRGPEIIEVNGRVAGYNARLISLAGGASLIGAAMDVAAGRPPSPPVTPAGSAAMLMVPAFPERAGVVRSAVSRADLRALPGVVAVDEVAARGELRAATGYRMATLMLRASSLAELSEAAGHVQGAIRLLYAQDLPGEAQPAR